MVDFFVFKIGKGGPVFKIVAEKSTVISVQNKNIGAFQTTKMQQSAEGVHFSFRIWLRQLPVIREITKQFAALDIEHQIFLKISKQVVDVV